MRRSRFPASASVPASLLDLLPRAREGGRAFPDNTALRAAPALEFAHQTRRSAFTAATPSQTSTSVPACPHRLTLRKRCCHRATNSPGSMRTNAHTRVATVAQFGVCATATWHFSHRVSRTVTHRHKTCLPVSKSNAPVQCVAMCPLMMRPCLAVAAALRCAHGPSIERPQHGELNAQKKPSRPSQCP